MDKIVEKLWLLLSSRKAWIALAAIVAIAVLVGLGKVTTPEMLDFYKWVVSAWLASIALETTGVVLAGSKAPTEPPLRVITTVDGKEVSK